MKKELSLFVTFVVFAILFGAISWAADQVTTPPSTTTKTLKPVLIKPPTKTPSASNLGGKSVSLPGRQADKSRMGIKILTIRSVTPNRVILSPGSKPVVVKFLGEGIEHVKSAYVAKKVGKRMMQVPGFDVRILGRDPRQMLAEIPKVNAMINRASTSFFIPSPSSRYFVFGQNPTS